MKPVPFYCPFCGETDLRPTEPSGWRCDSCDRVFQLTEVSVGGGSP